MKLNVSLKWHPSKAWTYLVWTAKGINVKCTCTLTTERIGIKQMTLLQIKLLPLMYGRNRHTCPQHWSPQCKRTCWAITNPIQRGISDMIPPATPCLNPRNASTKLNVWILQNCKLSQEPIRNVFGSPLQRHFSICATAALLATLHTMCQSLDQPLSLIPHSHIPMTLFHTLHNQQYYHDQWNLLNVVNHFSGHANQIIQPWIKTPPWLL